MAAMTSDQQKKFAAYLRGRLDYDWESKHLPLTILTDYCSRVLGRRVAHWRALSVEDAQRVMAAAKEGKIM